MLSWIWIVMIALAFGCGAVTGRLDAVGTAAIEGAQAAIELCLTIAGPICLWSGVMALMRAGGLTAHLTHFLHPLLRRLFPAVREDRRLLETIGANLAANLLGLGNAATPLGMAAAAALGKRSGKNASRELCTLVVMNTASLQLIPATIAAVRAGAGAVAPFDILPAVWIASAAALAAGLFTLTVIGKVRKWN